MSEETFGRVGTLWVGCDFAFGLADALGFLGLRVIVSRAGACEEGI